MKKINILPIIFIYIALIAGTGFAATLATGVLPFFDDGTVLLGKEYRERYSAYKWSEFGGLVDSGESFAQAAVREADEETAGSLKNRITLERVQQAEANGDYVDYLNPKSDVLYRMYFVKVPGAKPSIETIKSNAQALGSDSHVEKEDWKYFPASEIIKAALSEQDLNLPGTSETLYETTITRLRKPEAKKFFDSFLSSLR